MSRKSAFCYQCKKNGKIPMYYREKRVFRVAFYVCEYCMHFSGFINWTMHRSMPYYNDMKGLIRMRLVKNRKDKPGDSHSRKKRVESMQKNTFAQCIKCKKFDYSKLYHRNRSLDLFDFVGYVCKNCRVGYLIQTPNLKFHTVDPKGYYKKDGTLPRFWGIPFDENMGQFMVAIGEDQEKPKEPEITIRIKEKDIPRLKKSKINFESV